MPTFAYTARDSAGASVTGTLAGATLAEVTQALRREGKYPISVQEAAGAAPAQAVSGRGIKVPRAEVIQFATQLSIMIETGVTLAEAMDCIAAQCEKPKMKQLVEDLSEQLQSGADFSTALARHPRSFPQLFVALVKASEKSGMMSKLLNRGTTYLREEQETLRRVRGALTYPGIMLGFALTTTTFLLAFVMPRFTAIYASKGAALPLPTKVLMVLSGVLVGHWLAVLLTTAALVGGGYWYFRTPAGARLWHYLELHLPLLGGMFRKLHLSRGLRMVGTMAGAGVNLVDCVSTAHELCPNTYFRELWNQVTEKIQVGKQFSEPLFESPLVPRSTAQMLHSGEKSGKLAQVMEQVAVYSEQELKEKIAEMTRYIEPAMITVMGVIIGGVALALLLPIFSISKVMAQ